MRGALRAVIRHTMNRRQFLQITVAASGGAALPPRLARAQTVADRTRLRFAVIGINHEHIFRMVQAVREGGGELALIFAPDMDPNHGAKFLRENSAVRVAREEREVLDAPDIKLVVTGAKPAERAAVGVRAIRAGKDVLADKGGILSLAQLNELRRAQAETKRIFSISFNERLLLPVSVKVDELLHAGAIGRVTHMTGTGPHRLFGHGPREAWFWTRAGRGGILADIGAHQADQFIHYVGSDGAEVVASQTGNFENPDHPEFEDYGHMSFRSKTGTGEATVTFYSGKETTGFLLHLDGTEGRMEVRKHAGHIAVIGRDGKRREYRVDAKTRCPFGPRLVNDVLNRTETAMPQAHTFLASELAVHAQLAAVRLKERPAR